MTDSTAYGSEQGLLFWGNVFYTYAPLASIRLRERHYSIFPSLKVWHPISNQHCKILFLEWPSNHFSYCLLKTNVYNEHSCLLYMKVAASLFISIARSWCTVIIIYSLGRNQSNAFVNQIFKHVFSIEKTMSRKGKRGSEGCFQWFFFQKKGEEESCLKKGTF